MALKDAGIDGRGMFLTGCVRYWRLLMTKTQWHVVTETLNKRFMQKYGCHNKWKHDVTPILRESTRTILWQTYIKLINSLIWVSWCLSTIISLFLEPWTPGVSVKGYRVASGDIRNNLGDTLFYCWMKSFPQFHKSVENV